MIEDIQELNFPTIDGRKYATLSQATVNFQDMAECTITTQLKIADDIAPDFSFDWAVAFKGHKFIFPMRTATSTIESTSTLSSIELTFQHWAIYQLKSKMFFSVPNYQAEAVFPDKYIDTVSLNLTDFVKYYAMTLDYYFGDAITIDLNPQWVSDKAPTLVEINYSKLWDILIKFYELFAVRWQIEPNGDIEHYVIKVGYDTQEVSHIFEYGFEGGLLKFQQQVQDENIANMLLGRGSSENLPYRYFKNQDPNNPTLAADPDWIPELKDVYFAELRGATFRSYIQGWRAKHISQYRQDYPDEDWTLTITDAQQAYAPWAFEKGYTDEKFDPVEYVKDDESILRYGEILSGLENNEEIKPTIQGMTNDELGRLDETVKIGEVTDIPEEKPISDAQVSDAPVTTSIVRSVPKSEYKKHTYECSYFGVSQGKYADLIISPVVQNVYYNGKKQSNPTQLAEIKAGSINVIVINAVTGEEHSASGIPEGTWSYRVTCEVHNMDDSRTLDIEIGDNYPKLIEASPIEEYTNTWEIWLKNIWGTQIQSGESALAYAERVWRPILGDHLGEDAAVIFTDGMLAMSEDYTFTIVKMPEYDLSVIETITDKDSGLTLRVPISHWKLTLAKSDADLDATGLYVPSTKRFAVSGNHIAFVGIDVPHKYVTEAEIKLDNWKKDELEKVKDIVPPITVGLDKVRVHNYGNGGALVDELKIGSSLRIADKRFLLNADGTPMAYKTLYVQSITYTYNEPTDTEANLIPDIEITLGDEYQSSGNVVSQITSDISALQRQVGSISNVAQIVRSVGDARYLRKDTSDRASAPIEFAQGLDSQKHSYMREGVQFGQSFAEGVTGFGGKIDKYGDAWLGGLHLRSFLEVPELRYNRTEISIGNDWNAPGGGIIERVSPDYDDDGLLTDTGVITLKLEDGEIGAVAVGDLCSGIYHDEKTLSNNAVADSDDGKGNFHFAGFCTVYFSVTEILDESRNSVFRYKLRPISATWTQQRHPSAQMHFVGYGNTTDTQRQTSRYSTRTYERYLRNVNDWEFGEYNIAAQFGDLSNLSIQGISMAGYSAYLNNIYMTGRIEQLDLSLRMSVDYGDYNFIKPSETKTITCKVYRGFEDMTSKVTSWSLYRNTGDGMADYEFSLEHRDFNGTITLDYASLGADPESGAEFTFIAQIGQESARGSVKLRREPIDGTNGTNGTDGKDGANYSQNLLFGSEFPVKDKWTFLGSTTAIDGTYKFQGRNSVKVNAVGNTAKLYFGLKQYFDGELSVGDVFTVSIWLYCEDVTTVDDVIGLELQVYDADNNRVATGAKYIYPNEVKEGEWRQLVAKVTIPENAATMLLNAYVRTNGVVWFSSPKLERGDNPTPVWTPNPQDRVAELTEEFYFSTSNYILFGGTWSDKMPQPIPTDKFKWTRIKLSYGDGTVTYTEPVCVTGDKGDKGDKGDTGAQGIQGCIYRVTQWQSGKEYRNDLALTSGVRYVDVVLIPAPLLETKAYAFMCAQTHTSTADNAPDTTGDTEYWTKMNSFAPIYTPFLLADGAAITLLQSNRIYVLKDDGEKVNVGMGGGNYPLWIGSELPDDANFKVDANGKATLTEAEISGKVVSGITDGQRVELQPDNKAMKIYDKDGAEVASFEGNNYNNNADLIASESGTVEILTRTETKYGYGAGVTWGRGEVTHTGDKGLTSTIDEFNISSALHTAAPVQFQVKGYLYTKYYESVQGPDVIGPVEPMQPRLTVAKYSDAVATLYIKTYSDSTLTDLIGTQTVYSQHNKDGGISFNKKVKTTTGGYHVLQLRIQMQSLGEIPAMIKWGSQTDISATYQSDFYTSRYFANGLCLGQSLNDYIMAYNQGVADGMRFIVESRNYGLDVSNSGIKHRHHSGSFVPMPLLVMKGVYSYDSSQSLYTPKDAAMRSYNGKYPIVSRESTGVVKFTFPTSWRTDMPDLQNQFVVHITGLDSSHTIKGNIRALTSTYLTISLSDDSTTNDGGFIIEIYQIE